MVRVFYCTYKPETQKNIHETCVRNGQGRDGFINYVKGANISGFLKVANAMRDLGLV